MKTYIKLLLLFVVVLSFVFLGESVRAMNLSQTNVFLYQGQSVTVYAYSTSAYLYVSSNSNYNVASVSVAGNNINIYGNSVGNTTVALCEGSGGLCNNIYVNVNSGERSGNIKIKKIVERIH